MACLHLVGGRRFTFSLNHHGAIGMRDFFFGEIMTLSKSREPYMGLSEAGDLASKVSAAFFTSQLNRLLSMVGNQLVLSDGTSYPRFQAFVDGIEVSQVGLVEIKARTDVNSNVKATLECSICLTHGVVHVRPHWCAYKPIRADEVISTLLVPLQRSGLAAKTFIRWSDEEVEELPVDPRRQIEDIFMLSGYSSGWDDGQRDRMSEYEQELERARSEGLALV